jgi:alkylated DNA repair dioxygenase AlkB
VVAWQGSLFDVGVPVGPRPLDDSLEHCDLGQGAWLEIRRDWIAGQHELFDRLDQVVPWRADRRPMYDRVVDVPRLVAYYGLEDDLPDPVLAEMRADLLARYGDHCPKRTLSTGVCLYRDGRDSVAWHGDRIGRTTTEDTLVAVVSLGTPRRFLLRPKGGGTALRFVVGNGDLLVMGGKCQQTYEHAVPKTSRPIGPRISVQFRSHQEV